MAEHDPNNLIEKINPSTYRFKLAGDDIEIGDIKSSEFKPHMKLKRWGEECFFGIHLPIKIVKYVLEENKVKARTTANMEIHFYPLKPESRNFGGAEFEVILKKKPSKNNITLDIETQGLKFYYQPSLTEKSWPEGYAVTETEVRDENGKLMIQGPENVVGSYAVYHATKTNMHASKAAAEKYKCGKAFHIYRPQAHDVEGNKQWCNLNIKNGKLTITIPQEFLDNAIYPVRITGTRFGCESIGEYYVTIRYVNGGRYTCEGIGNLDSMTAHIVEGDTTWGSGISWEYAIYEDGGVDGKKVDVTDSYTSKVGDGDDWYPIDFSDGKGVTAQDYWLYAAAEKKDLGLSMDATGGDQRMMCYAGGYGNWPATLDDADFDENHSYLVSIYATYSVAGPAFKPQVMMVT